MKREWSTVRSMWFSAGAHDPRLPTAGFDFDSTLRPYCKRGPPEELTLRFLAALSAAFNIVIVSNRSAASLGALAPIREYVAALDAVTSGLASICAPTARDRDRKPHTGAWEHYVGSVCKGAAPWFSFFCGDAAGRPGDHSAADYMFALNIGAAFVTPEALFEGGGEPWAPDGWNAPLPGALMRPAPQTPLEQLIANPAARNCVLLVGSPASGKSRLARRLAERGFAVVSRDVQGSRAESAFASALARGENVVVDNTHPLLRDRALAVGKALQAPMGYEITVCHVDTPKDVCFHLNAARCQLDPTGRTKEVPPVALHCYWKRLELPGAGDAALGARVVVVPFALDAGAPPEVVAFRYPLS